LRSGALRRDGVARVLLMALALLLAYFSFGFKAQIGYRYAMPLLPLAWILAASGLAPLASRPAAVRAFALACAVALGEDLVYLGNPLSFTNAAVQPKRLVFRLIADSNVDWGQNREKIDAYLESHGIATHLDPPHLLAGHNTLRLNALAGVWNFERYRFLREHADPRGHFLHTYLWFDVSDELYNEYMDAERRFAPSLRAPELCPPTPTESLAAGDERAFSVREQPAKDTTWIGCAAVRKDMDFGLRSEHGVIFVGHYGADAVCVTDAIEPGQVLWYRLEPGLHAFCLAEPPNRRAQLPYAFAGRLLARGRRVELSLREASVEWSAPRESLVPE
jgi:hypothetical protein